MAESGSIKCETGEFALAPTTFLQILETDGITEAHEVGAHMPFLVAQLVVLAIFIALEVVSVRKFHPLAERHALRPY